MQEDNKVWVSAKVPFELKAKVQKAAKKKVWSVSTFIEQALSKALMEEV